MRGFEPRFSVRGPLKRDRAFIAQDFQFRYVATPVKSLTGEPEIKLKSFDSFTRVDTVISARHTLGGGLISFPREVKRATMNTFRPPEVTPDFNQSGWSTGVVDRLALAPDVVLETTLSGRWFEVNVNTDGRAPMVYAPQTQSGSFFNDQERDVGSLQWVEALSLSRDWRGQHVFKLGTDLQRSQFDGFSASRPVEIRRLDGSLAELTVFGGRTEQEVGGFEFAVFAQDRWRIGSRVDVRARPARWIATPIVERVNWSPRAGVAIGVAPEGRAILRGGFGKFVQRTPLNVEAFPSFEPRTVSRFAADGSPLGAPVDLRQRPRRRPATLPKPTSATSSGISASAGACSSSSSSCSATARTSSSLTPDAGRGRAAPVEHRHVALQGARGDDAVSGRRAAGPDRLVRLGERDRRSQQLRSVLRQLPQSDHPPQREQSDSDRRPPSAARARHDRAAGPMGFRAGARAPIRVPVVGGERVPGLRRAAQPRRAPARGAHARFHARAALAVQEVPLPRRRSSSTTSSGRRRTATCRTT